VDQEGGTNEAPTTAALAPAQSGPTLDDFLKVLKNTLNKVSLDKDQPPLKKSDGQLADHYRGYYWSKYQTLRHIVWRNKYQFVPTNVKYFSGQLRTEKEKEASGALATASQQPPVSTVLARTIESAQASPKAAGFDQNSKSLNTNGLSLAQKFIVKKQLAAELLGNSIGR